MTDFIIKPMQTENEINGKAYVHYKSWQETYAGLVSDEYLSATTLEKCEKLAHRFNDNTFVAKIRDKVIGFVNYGEYRGTDLSEHGEVYAIYVLKEYHGAKIGYELMNAAIKISADYNKIAVWVLKDNTQAIKFYERYGFRPDGAEQEIDLGGKVTEIRMILDKNNILSP